MDISVYAGGIMNTRIRICVMWKLRNIIIVDKIGTIIIVKRIVYGDAYSIIDLCCL